jgi:hypothetical protein
MELNYLEEKKAAKQAKLDLAREKQMYGDFRVKYDGKKVDQYYGCSKVKKALLYMVV